jgi:hypothetical protein
MLTLPASAESIDADPPPDHALAHAWDSDEARAARAALRMRTLGELAEIGMTIARALERQVLDEAARAADDGRATGSAGPIDAGLGLAFARVSRAVRQTLALEEKFDRPLPAPVPSSWDERAAWLAQLRDDPDIARLGVAVHRDDVRAHVEQVIAAEADGPEAARLLADLEERLDDAEAGEDFADRPLGELVAGICRDLGVTPDWNLWRNEDWAMDEARANTPGSPYARPKPRRTWPDEPWRDPPRSRAAAVVHPP